jgi:hypothetical protein
MRRVQFALAVVLAALLAVPAAAPALPLPALTLTDLQGPASSVFGDAYELTATVTTLGVPVTAGTVDFYEIAGPAGCDDVALSAGGVATCQVTGSPVGLHTFSALYSGTSLLDTSADGPLVHSVGKAPVTVTAPSRTITYGGALPTDLAPTLTGTAAGLLTGAPACSITGTPANAGSYADVIVCAAGTLDTASFLLSFVPGDLTIAKAPATVTVNPLTAAAGQALPAVTATVTGLLGADTLTLACAGPSPLPTTPGVYPGALTCLADALNYVITLVPATLTILAPPASGGAGGGGTTNTTNTTTNVTNVVGGSGTATKTPAATTLKLLTTKLKAARKAKLKLRSGGRIDKLTLLLKRNGKTVAKSTLATLNGDGSITLKAKKKLAKGVYTVQASWGASKKRFSIRVR